MSYGRNSIKIANNNQIVFDVNDNSIAIPLFGESDKNIKYIEKSLNLKINARGNILTIEGEEANRAKNILSSLIEIIREKKIIDNDEVENAIRLSSLNNNDIKKSAINTPKKKIVARSLSQANFINALKKNTMTFGVGPAGTGKTYLAVADAVEQISKGNIEKIILSRPAVEAGEQLGFLPGDLKDKIDPYLRPLYDALGDCMYKDKIAKFIEKEKIEIAPLAFMRGRTLSYSYIILDEAQNTTPMQMKMFLTRLGKESKMVITGDLTQIDLPKKGNSGLYEALEVTNSIAGVSHIKFDDKDVVRHPIVNAIVKSYRKKNIFTDQE
ncbi:MAG: PhoH-like protein [Alphaproteobacteria bacterium MarineAlpha9_Bin4]|nr:MAG: PhoH-like protein [Alphaproteobacteria bacterium MarineAlpha9_Bin4]